MSKPLKIAVIGPSKSGKSALIDLISLHKNNKPYQTSNKCYIETKGCRIVEVENFENNFHNCDSIQFWDVGGKAISYPDKCLPAVLNDTDGIILVFNPDNIAHCNEVELWLNLVVNADGILKDGNSLLVLMHDSLSRRHPVSSSEQVPSCLVNAKKINSSFATTSNEMRSHISAFLKQLRTI